MLQNCFRIKIIGPLRSQKSLCHGRSRRSERRQGRRPSWPGTSNAYPDRFAGGRSRPEGRQGRRPSLAGYQENFAAAPRPRKVSKRAAERFRGLGKLQNTPLNVSEASEAPKHAAEGFRGLGRRQGRLPSLTGYQENFLASAEAVRDAGQVLPGTRKTSLPRQRPSGTPAEHLKSPYPANFAGGRSRPVAAPQPPWGLSF